MTNNEQKQNVKKNEKEVNSYADFKSALKIDTSHVPCSRTSMGCAHHN